MNHIKNIFTLKNLLMVSILLFILLSSMKPLADNDMFFHIKNGENIIQNGLSSLDNFSIHGPIKYPQHEWLTGIIFYLIYLIYGFKSLWIFLIVYKLIFFIFLLYCISIFTKRNYKISLITALFTFCLLSNFYTIRPQIFSFIILIIECYVLETFDQTKKKRFLLILPILALLLANIHGASIPIFICVFFVYIISNLLYLDFSQNSAQILINKSNLKKLYTLMIYCSTCFIGFIVNPGGIYTLLYPFMLIKENFIFNFISELQPLTIHNLLGILCYLFIFLIILARFILRQTFSLKQFMFIFGTFAATLISSRFAAYFIIFGSILFAQYISDLSKHELIQSSNIKNILNKSKAFYLISYLKYLLVIIIVVESLSFKYIEKNFLDLSEFPEGVVSILQHQKDLRLFNEFNFGHFLIFNNIKVFVDGRAEIYSQSINDINVLNDFVNTKYGRVNPNDIFKKYNLNHFLIYKNTPLWIYFSNTHEYEQVYEGKNYVLFKYKK